MAVIRGTNGDDNLFDTIGDDTIDAGDGNDQITVTNGNDAVDGGVGFDTLVVDYSETTRTITTRGPNFSQRYVVTANGLSGQIGEVSSSPAQATNFTGIDRFVITTGSSDDSISTGAGDDFISTRAGDDRLNGGAGADRMIGGPGNDSYFVDNVGDIVGEFNEPGIDTVLTSLIDYSIQNVIGVENLYAAFDATATNFRLRGNSLDNEILGNGGNDFFDLRDGGRDHVTGLDGDDVFYFRNAFTTNSGTTSGDFVNGAGGNDTLVLQGDYSGINRLGHFALGNSVETILLLTASDNRFGGAGFGPLTYELSSSALFDSILTVDGSTLGASDRLVFETPRFAGGSGTLRVFGGAGSDSIVAGHGADTIDGGAGDDTLTGGAGADSINGGEGIDTVNYARDDSSRGVIVNLSSNLFVTPVGRNFPSSIGPGQALDGADDLDMLTGIENVRTGIFDDHVLGSDARNVVDTGAGNDLLQGNGGDDELRGGAGDDTLDGGAGNDLMIGGSGNDVYFVDQEGDLVVEDEIGGTDEVRTSLAAYTLGANVENLIGTSAIGQSVRGNAGDNRIAGGAGNDFFNASDGGNDTLAGGGGNDAFLFGAALTQADSVDGGTGNDQLGIQGNYTGGNALRLGNVVNVETLILQSGDDARFGDTANNSYSYDATTTDANVAAGAMLTIDANRLRASEGSTFNGGAETDGRFVYIGGAGRDDVTTGAGNDVIRLGAGGDVARAGAGNDLIDGGAGQDLMFGGTGDDVYIIETFGDTAVEDANAGTDEIRTDLASFFLGTSANVENLTGTSNAGQTLGGNGLNNVIIGAAGNDFIDARQGGDDSLFGNAGDDAFLFAGTLTSADRVDGGVGGNDQLGIQGDYTGANALTLGGVTNIETLLFLSGDDNRFGNGTGASFGYTVTTNDANVAAGATLTVDANRLRPGENVVFDGSAETDGGFFIYGGRGVDRFTGGSGNDIFLFREPGGFTADDRIVGGGGFDQLGLRGNYAFSPAEGSLLGLEGIVLISGRDTRFGRDTGQSFSYNFSTADDAVTAGQTFTIDAGTLRSDETLRFSGLREFDGNFRIFGGDGADNITGGFGNDVIRGGLGADRLSGFEGADLFRYDAVAESTAAQTDVVTNFRGGADKIDLSRIDADQTNAGGNDAFRFIGSAAFSGLAGELRTVYDAGTRMGRIEGDVNGDGVADLVIALDGLHNNFSGGPPAPLTANDFFL